MGILVLTAGWSACDRISSALETGPALTPEELPMRGETMLPDIGRPQPDIRITPRGDNRGKSGMAQAAGNQPGLDIDRAALRAYIEAMADIHNERYISLFVKADSSGGFYHYAYQSLKFHSSETVMAGGRRELYVYIHPNESDDGVLRMNMALLPATQTAFQGYARWLLPEAMLSEESRIVPLSRQKQSAQLAWVLVCYWQSWWQTGGAEGEYGDHHLGDIFLGCYYEEGQEEDWFGDDGGGGGTCWSCEEEDDSGGSTIPTGCNGDPGAFWDPVCPNRCVGGNTDREPALEGMDCTKICEDYGDSFLNRMDVQAEIQRIWNASYGPNSSPLLHDQRNEAVTFVNLFANNEWEFVTGTAQNVNSCFIEGLRIGRSNALFAILHTHPYVPDERVYDPRCYVRENENRKARGLALLSPGDGIYWAGNVSGLDSSLVARFEVPMYVIDREGVRKLDHNTFVPGERASYAATYNHCWP